MSNELFWFLVFGYEVKWGAGITINDKAKWGATEKVLESLL